MGLFETTEEELYQIAISRPLEEKIEQAIKLIRLMEKHALELSPEGYYVAFSGGKDSIVMERVFRMAGVRYQSYYNNVTIDPPELVRFIKKHYPEAKWNSVGKPLPFYMENKISGPPTRMSRWCCEVYKEQGGQGRIKAVGVRAEESARRKGLWKQIVLNRRSGATICPILYWTDADIWQFIRDNGMPYCCLYDEGFSRLGCIGCPEGGFRAQAREFERWPRYERLWRLGFQKYWDRWKGTPRKDGEENWLKRFNTVDDLWAWWVSGKAADGDKPDCQLFLW